MEYFGGNGEWRWKYDDMITIEIDGTHGRGKSAYYEVRYKLNDGVFGDRIRYKVCGDVLLSVGINYGESDYVQLLM